MENTYIENKHNLPVGYGYRLLGREEFTLATDEFWNNYYLTWELMPHGSVNTQPKTWGPTLGARRKIDVGAGYRLVELTESAMNHDGYKIYHTKFSSDYKNIWILMINPVSYLTVENWYIHCGIKDQLITNGIAFRRKVCDTTCLQDHINKLQEEVSTLQKELNNCKKDTCAAEEFKVGDYIVCIDNKDCDRYITKGQIYTLNSIFGGFFDIEEVGGGYYPYRYRKATRVEIEKYLLDKAVKDGFVIGANAKIKGCENIYSIKKIKVLFPEDIKNRDGDASQNVIDKVLKSAKPCVFVVYGHYSSTIDEVVIVKELPIIVKVDNAEYTAEFKANRVEFGCAHISNQQILKARDFLDYFTSDSNRQFEAVQIGKGLFTKEILNRLVTKINSNNKES